jgi:hypothetical protein
MRPIRSRPARAPSRRPVSLVAAVVLVGVVIAGCGSGSHVASLTTTHTTKTTPAPGTVSQYTSALEYARCMRRHGETDFPDPSNPGGFSTAALNALNTQSHQFIAASTVCQRLLPNDGQPTPAELQVTITNALRFARCVRAHGVNFPDPGISGDNITINMNDFDPSSPQYLRAAQICKTKPGG